MWSCLILIFFLHVIKAKEAWEIKTYEGADPT